MLQSFRIRQQNFAQGRRSNARPWRLAVRPWVLGFGLLVMLFPTALHGQAYSLPPEKMKLAVALFRTRTLLHFVGTVWEIVQLVLLLALGLAARLRTIAVGKTRSRWGQCFLFTFLLLGTTTLLDLPLRIYGHHLSLTYGLSVQGWGSWLGDAAKSFVLEWGPLGLGAMVLFWLIGRSPRRWWLWFWVPAMAAIVFGVFVSPIFIDPLFNHFEPLVAHDPALVTQLQRVVARASLVVPPERMFWMRASDKYTGLNAYVTGLGPSKRVVVWDTSIAKATPDEIAFIFGHEMGHYVLNHIYKGIAFAGVLMLIGFWVGFQMVQYALRRWSGAWDITSQHDWAALVLYLLVLAVLGFVAEPIVGAYSRAQEHAADIYGQEAIHGIVAAPQATTTHAFQVLGETSLEDPTLHPLVEWWSYDHPATARRAAFAAGYDPWSNAGHGRYFTH